ncbi:LysR family transcriptional regulator [Cocleimonas flava]|uniref:DNA-binding transcriptional LysR family regulator n=1 Tax=Cocleimonas flava TaxID=634765 RepID=A0A4R1EWZ2_9GAMM|nr:MULTISPECIES: LysR family transcriptional regulator [Cocleimonas]MEB8434225.1 LysR family transcriptional regulator [Cocleimonas sp. KMM 6892]MEC4717156.1 LysR family transcriptional regulator [Cocleimonas sp. KMM 6895]MEC4746497.1 LysR family transcriptional regulator [Cocleimonas sp. KMM 6896]TCJ84474.1 DNA-binding transcriptional LysR family regulator [Cocleimonas flava]
MEIRQLKTLVNILDFGGFAAAGDALGLTQSAISLQIKALEAEFGEVLFDRSKRPPLPTAKAIALAQKSREILRLCNDLGEMSKEQLSGSLQLGAHASVQRTLVPVALKQLLSEHPNLFVSVTTGLSDELSRSVYRGVLDAAIVSEPTKLPTGMSWNPFASEELVVIAQKKAKGKTAIEVLENNPYIRFKRTSWLGELINTEIKDLGIKVKTAVETDHIGSIWEMVSCGLGVAIVPSNIVEHEIKGAVGGKKKITNSLSIQSPHENLRPRNIRTFTLGTNPMRLTTGLIERTADPKAHLIAALYGALQD